MRFSAAGILIAAAALLAACGEHDDPQPPSIPAKKTFADPLVDQLDHVKQQAETLPKERKQNLDEAIEADEQ